MSLTQSRGLTDAGRWTAVATALAEHLDSVERAIQHDAPPPAPPRGAIEAARRFFRFVLSGIALDKRRSTVTEGSLLSTTPGSQAISAGISNLSIAVKVIGSNKPDDLQVIEQTVKSYLGTVDRLEEKQMSATAQEREALSRFFRALQRQGEIERDATIASQEGPRSYRAMIS